MNLGRYSVWVDRLLLLVGKVPEIEAHITETYPAGSYERKAFGKLNALVPEMDELASRLVEAGTGHGPELTAVERQRLQDIDVAVKDAEAIMQEAGIEIRFTDLPPGFAGLE